MFRARREEYGDASIGYVQVKRVGNLCTVKSKVCPEHRIRAAQYNVVLEVDEVVKKVKNVQCFSCVAGEGNILYDSLNMLKTNANSKVVVNMLWSCLCGFTEEVKNQLLLK